MKFSQLLLLNILFLVTTAGALFALYSSQQRNRQMAAAHEMIKSGLAAEINALESEIKAHKAEGIKLREEFGFLTIGDQSKIHAIAIPFVQQSKTWTYRVYLPEGNDYLVACKINDLPIGSEKPKHNFHTPGTSTVAGGPNTIAPRDAPLVLLDGRSFGETVKSSDKSTEGIILWIEMVPSIAKNEQLQTVCVGDAKLARQRHFQPIVERIPVGVKPLGAEHLGCTQSG